MVQAIKDFKIGSFLERKAGISAYSYHKSEESKDRNALKAPAKEGREEISDDPCPSCGCIVFIADHVRAENVCKACGLVIEERIMDTARHGWRVFDQEDAANKVSAEPVKIDGNMTTRIGSPQMDYGKLNPEMRNKMKRLTKTQSRNTLTRDDKHIREAMNDLRVIAGKLGLSNKIRDEAVISFKKEIKGKCLRGKSVYNLMTSILLNTCKNNGIPFKFTEFSKQADIGKKKLSKAYMSVVQGSNDHSLSSPIDYLPRFSSELHLTDAAVITAQQMLSKVISHVTYSNLSIGKEAAGYAAATVYIASLENNLQPIREMRLVAIVTMVAESTLKKRVEEIAAILGLDQNRYKEEKYSNFSKSEHVRYRLKPSTL